MGVDEAGHERLVCDRRSTAGGWGRLPSRLDDNTQAGTDASGGWADEGGVSAVAGMLHLPVTNTGYQPPLAKSFE